MIIAEDAALDGYSDAYGVRNGLTGFSLFEPPPPVVDSGEPARGVASALLFESALEKLGREKCVAMANGGTVTAMITAKALVEVLQTKMGKQR